MKPQWRAQQAAFSAPAELVAIIALVALICAACFIELYREKRPPDNGQPAIDYSQHPIDFLELTTRPDRRSDANWKGWK